MHDFDRRRGDFAGRSDHGTPSGSTAGEPYVHGIDSVPAAQCRNPAPVIIVRRTSKLARPNDQCILEQATRFQVCD